MTQVLFVCTGNTCRSALAEAIARAAAHERGIEALTFGSAGTSAWDGSAASDGAILVGIERQLELNLHRSRALTRRNRAQRAERQLRSVSRNERKESPGIVVHDLVQRLLFHARSPELGDEDRHAVAVAGPGL